MSLFESADFHVVEDDAKGRGLFVNRQFVEGEFIYLLDYWSAELMPMHLTNHSCEPNAGFNDAGELIALRDIAAGEEVTYNYLSIPLPASPWNFACHCQTDSCRGWVHAGGE